MFGFGHTELLIILLLAVVLFGAKRLPEIGKALGRIGSEYREGKNSVRPDQGKGTSDQAEPDAPESGLDIEAEIKNQIVSRMPGVGRLNRLKKTAEMVNKVARAAEKSGDPKSGSGKES